MARVKGLVIKIEQNYCHLLTPDGQFRRYPLPPGKIAVGMEVDYTPRPASRRPLIMLVASILVLLMGWQLFAYSLPPAAAAYLSLDLNSSLQLAIDDQGVIVGVEALDESARVLIQNLSLPKQPLFEGLEHILAAAVESGYLDPSSIVLAAVAPAHANAGVPVTIEQVAASIDRSLQANGVAARIVVAPTPSGYYQASRQQGLSLGKYALGEAARELGEELNTEELKQQIVEIEHKKQFKVENIFWPEDKEKRDNNKPAKAANAAADNDGKIKSEAGSTTPGELPDRRKDESGLLPQEELNEKQDRVKEQQGRNQQVDDREVKEQQGRNQQVDDHEIKEQRRTVTKQEKEEVKEEERKNDKKHDNNGLFWRSGTGNNKPVIIIPGKEDKDRSRSRDK